jgi:tetratricopeptide (TPR) repeat protein
MSSIAAPHGRIQHRGRSADQAFGASVTSFGGTKALTKRGLAGRAVALASLLCAVMLGAASAWGQAAEAVEPMAGPVEDGDPLGAPPAPGPPPALALSAEPALLRAWSLPAPSLEVRVARTRRAGLESGTWSFDPAARAVLRGAPGGDPVARAEAAVALAPQLPLAHMELAKAHWLHEDAPMAALHATQGALGAISEHPEASLWFAGSGLCVLAIGVCAGTLLLFVLVALRAAPHAAHDLGHLAPGDPPGFARFAMLAALLLVPVAAREGVFGLALVLLLVGTAYGSAWQRSVLIVAAAALWAALFPMARLSAAALEAFPQDPVARAAYSVGQGLASAADLRRLEGRAEDPLALRALAMDARRRGQLGRADVLYQQIAARTPGDVAALNNAANVRLALGHLESAIDLYGRALDFEESPVVLFNLSQAYGRGFHVDELNRTLADAQRVDGELVGELTALQREQHETFVVDLPLGAPLLWHRAFGPGAGETIAAALRAPLAPGRLGASEPIAALSLAATLCAGIALGGGLRRSRGCARCASRLCDRCGTDRLGPLCESCDTLFNHPERTDRTLRFARLEALRKRDRRVNRAALLASLCVPGAAGLLANRPLRAFAGALGFTVAAAALWWRDGVVPDPLIAGSAAPAVFGGVAALALLVYAASVLTSLAARRGGEP